MKWRSQTPKPSGFTRAEALESREQVDELTDLVGIGHFLAPEMHRQGGVDEAASAVREWAEDDVDMMADSAEILHRARILAVA